MFMMGNSNVNNLVSPDTTIPHNYHGATVISHHETRITRSLQDQPNLCSSYNLKTGDLLVYITQLLLQQGPLVSNINKITNINSFNNMHFKIRVKCQCVMLSGNNTSDINENTDQAALLHDIQTISNTGSFNNMLFKLNFIQSSKNNENYNNNGKPSLDTVQKFNNGGFTKEYNLRTCSFKKNTQGTNPAKHVDELLRGVGSISNVNSFNNVCITIHVECPCENNNNINKDYTDKTELIRELINGVKSMTNFNSFRDIHLRIRIDCQC